MCIGNTVSNSALYLHTFKLPIGTRGPSNEPALGFSDVSTKGLSIALYN